MKGSTIIKLSVGLLTLVLACGCQMFSRGPSNEELINSTMADWKAALIAKDLDKLMAVYSENYVSSRGTDKVSVREFMMRVFERGYMDNVNINLEDAEITIEEDKAKVHPVKFISDRGTMTIEYTLQKESGTWLIVGTKRQTQ